MPDKAIDADEAVFITADEKKNLIRQYRAGEAKVAKYEYLLAVEQERLERAQKDRDEKRASFLQASELIMSAGPHGVVLALTQTVDNLLTALVRDHMPSLDKRTEEALFSGTGALATFSARIYLAKALGLIEPKLAAELHKLRKFRNMFAHSTKVLDFNDKEVAGLVNRFETPLNTQEIGHKAAFTAFVATLSMQLKKEKSEAGSASSPSEVAST